MYAIPADALDYILPEGIPFQLNKSDIADFIFLDNVKAMVNGIFIVASASVTPPKFESKESPDG